MDVIFAAINKFLRFLSGFSHTHRFCYQPVNLCLRHYEIRFLWMKCCPKWGENNIAQKLQYFKFLPSLLLQTECYLPLGVCLGFFTMVQKLKLDRNRQHHQLAFFSNSREGSSCWMTGIWKDRSAAGHLESLPFFPLLVGHLL